MFVETEGIILRRTDISGGRMMMLLFSKKYGKISVGTNVTNKQRGKSGLAFRPFTYGIYELFKKSDYYNINGVEVKESFYRIGEDIDKFMAASLALELLDKTTEEAQPLPQAFNLTIDFLKLMEKRSKSFDTLVLAYAFKLLNILGLSPKIDAPSSPEESKATMYFNIPDGEITTKEPINNTNQLIYKINFDIVDVLRFFNTNPMENLEKIALKDDLIDIIKMLFREYYKYHLGIDKLNSDAI